MSVREEEFQVPGYEKVVYREDPSTNLRAIVAIHNTNLGPACGGLRILPYSSKDEALKDVLRLAKGMSYKSALAGIGFGGGKSVLILDPSKKSPETFHAFGDFVDTFGGKYLAAQDMNTTAKDLAAVKTHTRHVLGIEGETGSSGDPSPVTARGVLRAIEATLEELNGTKKLNGVKIAIQGVGSVGYRLAELVRSAGADLWVTDVDASAVKRAQEQLGAHPVAMNAIYDTKCDIFSPCARGAVLNMETIPMLKCKAVVGAANNQLQTEADGQRLHERGILYVPDYAANAGGIINIFVEFQGYDSAKALSKADGIFATTKEILKRSKASNSPPYLVADKLAEERMNAVR